jgi:hypothetical protein
LNIRWKTIGTVTLSGGVKLGSPAIGVAGNR